MNADAIDVSILGPAFLAGLLVLATHVPLGREVLARGIIFIDLAIAQMAGLGAIAANQLHLELGGLGPEVGGSVAALAGALLLTALERLFPDVLEALIGVLFALAATGGILLLANDPHGGEELKDLLVGQILWVTPRSLVPVAVLYAVVLALWFSPAHRAFGRAGFYLLFALTVTASVQLVGVYLVFATLIVPAVSTRGMEPRRGLALAWALGLGGYVAGLVASSLYDLPTGALIVWALAALATIVLGARRIWAK
jgi:zinc/manganese transport system permease protein